MGEEKSFCGPQISWDKRKQMAKKKPGTEIIPVQTTGTGCTIRLRSPNRTPYYHFACLVAARAAWPSFVSMLCPITPSFQLYTRANAHAHIPGPESYVGLPQLLLQLAVRELHQLMEDLRGAHPGGVLLLLTAGGETHLVRACPRLQERFYLTGIFLHRMTGRD